MKHQISFRVIVKEPLAGVTMKVQEGKSDLLAPSSVSSTKLVFDFDITVDIGNGVPNFLGKFAQGPKDARFVYVNSGTYAGQHTAWARRAKLSLMSITPTQISETLAHPGSRLEATMPGIGSDGGPTCASVKGLEWRVAKK